MVRMLWDFSVDAQQTPVRFICNVSSAFSAIPRVLSNENWSFFERGFGSPGQIVAYAGDDLGGDSDDSKSTSGYVIYVDGILITWKSKKQSITAQSTVHAELFATASAK